MYQRKTITYNYGVTPAKRLQKAGEQCFRGFIGGDVRKVSFPVTFFLIVELFVPVKRRLSQSRGFVDYRLIHYGHSILYHRMKPMTMSWQKLL
jgi:hypothetical protein